jgi:hypothetical protein
MQKSRLSVPARSWSFSRSRTCCCRQCSSRQQDIALRFRFICILMTCNNFIFKQNAKFNLILIVVDCKLYNFPLKIDFVFVFQSSVIHNSRSPANPFHLTKRGQQLSAVQNIIRNTTAENKFYLPLNTSVNLDRCNR